MALPEILESGERARLFPVIADTSKEGRALSIFLSCLTSVNEFGGSLLSSLGLRLGTRSRVSAFTEVVLKSAGESKLRPDALIVVATGRRQWHALVEAKIGKAELEAEQVEAYARLAKTAGVDAVITISNQFVALPDHHPVVLPKHLTKSIGLFHWSWMYIVTQANLLISAEGVADTDQQYLLKEMLRFFGHPSAGVTSFDQMNAEWRDIIVKVQTGEKLLKSSPEIENTVASWHQEVRDLALIMSRKLQLEVSAKLARRESANPVQRLRNDITRLVQDSALSCALEIPDAASPLNVLADLRSRCVVVSMRLSAPGDRKSSKARINWLLRQLGKSDPAGVFLRAIWPGRAEATQASLADLRNAIDPLESANKSLTPTSFEVLGIKDLGGRFGGRRTFIEEIEEIVPAFYENVGQHLRQWQPPAPKIKPELTAADLESSADTDHAGAPTSINPGDECK